MSPFIVTSLNSNGSVFMLDTDTIDAVNGSQAYTQGFVVGTLDAVDTATDPFMSGARYRADGALRLYDATSALPAQVYYDSGIAFTSSGQMCITQGAVSNPVYISGMAVRTDGAVYATPASFYLPLADAGNGAVDTTAWGKGASQSATFTRATTATTVNSVGLIVSVASGVARSYYDPTTLFYGGYLAEGTRTNLLLRSEEFDNASWTKTDTTITANAIASPDGTTTADLCAQGTAGTASAVQVVTATADATYTLSVFLKYGNTQWFRLLLQNGANQVAGWFDIQNGAAGTTGVSGTGSSPVLSIKAYPNGWYRCTLSGVIGSAATAITSFLRATTGNGSGTPNNNGTYYAWGAQFENSSAFPSTYIPTTTASVTRNADVLTYPFSGNASATVGTCYAEVSTNWSIDASLAHAYVSYAAGPRGLVSVSNRAATVINGFDGTNVAQKTGLTSMQTGSRKRALSYGSSTMSVTGDGQTVASATFNDNMGSTGIGIGCSGAGANQADGTIKNVRIWQTQFSAAQLQAITS